MDRYRLWSVAVAIALFAVAPVPAAAQGIVAPPGSVRYLHDAAGNLTRVVDTATDVNNCGELGTRCPTLGSGTAACVAGACGAVVDGQFVDVWTDVTHCGPSLSGCGTPAHGNATCVAGVCGVECWSGYVRTGLSCVDLTSDPSNCGRESHVCEGTGAVCTNGRCRIPGTPVVSAVNGATEPGVALRASYFTGILVEGTNLDNVTAVELEDWGPDEVGTDVAAPLATGFVLYDVAFRSADTSLVIPAAALEAFAGAYRPFLLREWYKLRLHYYQDGIDGSVLVDVAVSLDDQVPLNLPAPGITDVSLLELHVVRSNLEYDPATGFIQLFYPEDCGPDLRTVPPIAVLGSDPLRTEYPVYGVSLTGIRIQAGLDPARVHARFWQYIGGEMAPDDSVTLVFPYSTNDGVVNLGSVPPWVGNESRSALPPRCSTQERVPQIGGVVLRGSNLYADGSLTISRPPGTPASGDLGAPVFLGDRIVVPPRLDGPGGNTPVISGIDGTERSFIEFSSPRGVAATPRGISWLGPPAVASVGPQPFVTYNQVMTLTGNFFTRLTDVSFIWAPADADMSEATILGVGIRPPLQWKAVVEHLSPTSASPGPGQFRIVDEHHLEVFLSSAGGPVPRGLTGRCLMDHTPFVDAFPGERRFRISNPAGVSVFTVSALDPAGLQPAPVVLSCRSESSGGGPSAGPNPAPPQSPGPSVGPPLKPTRPNRPNEDCSSNSFCP